LRLKLMKNNNAWVYSKIKPFIGNKVLELGAGIGTMSNYFVSYGRELTLTDTNDDYITYLKNRFVGNNLIKAVKMDICNIDKDLPGGKFDTIIGINILEHIADDLDLLRRLKNILSKDGKLLLMVPAHKMLFGSLDKELKHCRRYSKKELTNKLKDSGYVIEKIQYMDFLAAIGWFMEYRIFKNKHIPIIKIRLLDNLIPFIAAIEKCISFPFGLSLLAIAKSKEDAS